MFRSWLKVIFNGFFRNKLYSFINVFGLAVGLAGVMLIGLYVVDEFSYDKQFRDADRIYRISRDFYPLENSEEMYLATAAAPVAPLLQEDFSEVELTARMSSARGLLSRRETDTSNFEDGLRFVDASFFQMFDFEWLQGDPATAMESPTALVLTESAARRYFGNENPLGQALWLENQAPMQITGVIADLPANTHLSATAFLNLEGLFRIFGEAARTSWGANGYHSYVKLAPGTDIKTLEAQFPAFMNRHLQENASMWTGLSAMKISDIHLQSDKQLELTSPGSMSTVLTLISVAVGILLIACFNFMNLSTARSSLRGKEVGVRKTIGSSRSPLILQFLGESIGMTLLATLLAIVLVELLLPAFNAFTGKALALDLIHNSDVQGLLLLLVLAVGLLAGSYPAFYLSSFKPVEVLRSKVSASLADVLLRNLLVIMQFSISIVLVIATGVVMLQTQYARNLDLGFNKDQVVVLGGSPSVGLSNQWEALKQTLLQHPEIESVTASGIVPGMENLNTFGAREEGATEARDLPAMMVDYDFFATYDVKVLSGRVFSREFPNDLIELPGSETPDKDSNFVINASAARNFGWTPETAIGKEMNIFDNSNGYSRTGHIIGVVADSKFESVRFSVKPLVFLLVPNSIWSNNTPVLSNASIRISGNNTAATLDFIDQAWKQAVPQFPITRSFLEDTFEALYQNDRRLGQLFTNFAALAILIACLGLFGLATFNTQRRIKEIGIRKVMGGSVWSIVLLLTNDFSKLVLISNLIAWPLAYFAMNSWLANFAYRIDLTPLVFVGSGIIAFLIAWVTVGSTAAKAASQKPVLALRYE